VECRYRSAHLACSLLMHPDVILRIWLQSVCLLLRHTGVCKGCIYLCRANNSRLVDRAHSKLSRCNGRGQDRCLISDALRSKLCQNLTCAVQKHAVGLMRHLNTGAMISMFLRDTAPSVVTWPSLLSH